MKTSMLFLSLPIAAALAFAPHTASVPQDAAQDPQNSAEQKEVVAITPMSELQYTNLQGKTTVVSARTVVEIRMWDDAYENVQLELIYENGDYSRITAQAIHVIRNGASTRDVRLVRCSREDMRFPRMP